MSISETAKLATLANLIYVYEYQTLCIALARRCPFGYQGYIVPSSHTISFWTFEISKNL